MAKFKICFSIKKKVYSDNFFFSFLKSFKAGGAFRSGLLRLPCSQKIYGIGGACRRFWVSGRFESGKGGVVQKGPALALLLSWRSRPRLGRVSSLGQALRLSGHWWPQKDGPRLSFNEAKKGRFNFFFRPKVSTG